MGCPDCGPGSNLVEDTSSGKLLCEECGLVVESKELRSYVDIREVQGKFVQSGSRVLKRWNTANME